MKIIAERRTIETITYEVYIESKEYRGGFAFPCDESGHILDDEHRERAAALENDPKYKAPQIERMEHRYREPAIGVCDDCGHEVALEDGLTNECDCGALYNMSGQRLVPREMWEERMDDDY